MSVKVENRTVSKSQYVYDAVKIYDSVIHFLSRMSARYSRLLAQGMMNIADEVCDCCVKASSVYDTDETRKALKKEYLLRARAAVEALDVKCTTCFRIMLQNPQGCYTRPDGTSELEPSEAKTKLEKLAQTLGDLINTEKDALTKIIKSV